MAFLLKKFYEGYFYLMNEIADPRALDYPLMGSPFPTIFILYLWFKFILQWGPKFMENKAPLNLKKVIILYNIVQIIINFYILYYVYLGRKIISWRCTEIDFSESYWGRKFLTISYLYFLLKVLDLLDTVFFVLRKKKTHISFLHTYHHFGMVSITWVGTKFVGGGHNYFLALANAPVHIILYMYYLLTSYDSRFGKVLWLKKFITQAQLIQFGFLIVIYGQLFFRSNCNFPMIVPYFFVPQNLFMIFLFGDFYIRTYYLNPRRKKQAAINREENGQTQTQIS